MNKIYTFGKLDHGILLRKFAAFCLATSGVSQGSILGTLFFYININYINHTFVWDSLSYSDDLQVSLFVKDLTN